MTDTNTLREKTCQGDCRGRRVCNPKGLVFILITFKLQKSDINTFCVRKNFLDNNMRIAYQYEIKNMVHIEKSCIYLWVNNKSKCGFPIPKEISGCLTLLTDL